MATCVDAGQAEYPKQVNGKAILPPEGVSLIPTLRDEPLERVQPLFWEHEGNRAIRDGKWKLVARGWKDSWQLYNIESDPTELTDLATQKPKKVKTLAEQWEAWAKRTNVYPRLGKNGGTARESGKQASGGRKSPVFLFLSDKYIAQQNGGCGDQSFGERRAFCPLSFWGR